MLSKGGLCEMDGCIVSGYNRTCTKDPSRLFKLGPWEQLVFHIARLSHDIWDESFRGGEVIRDCREASGARMEHMMALQLEVNYACESRLAETKFTLSVSGIQLDLATANLPHFESFRRILA